MHIIPAPLRHADFDGRLCRRGAAFNPHVLRPCAPLLSLSGYLALALVYKICGTLAISPSPRCILSPRILEYPYP